MVFIMLMLHGALLVGLVWLFKRITSHNLGEDDFWLDESACLAAGDQTVVDIALMINTLELQETIETNHQKRMLLRQKMKQQCGILVKTIMAINHIDPQPSPGNKTVVSLEDYLKR